MVHQPLIYLQEVFTMTLTSKKLAHSCATLAVLIGSAYALPAIAQSSGVYRCGNEYTNDTRRIERGGCTPLTGGNVTIIRGGPVRTSNIVRSTARAPLSQRSSPLAAPGAPANRPTVSSSTQQVRDQGARGILQMELDKASKRLAELQKEYNNGNPEKIGPEHRNYQKYLDRVANLKSDIARTESDIQGIRRELGRSGG